MGKRINSKMLWIRKKYLLPVLLVLLLILMMCSIFGCGSGQKTADNMNSSQPKSAEMLGVMESGKQNYVTNNDGYGTKEQKIIQNAHLSIRVADVNNCIENINHLVKEIKGYTVSSDVYKKGNRYSGNLIVKVPENQLQDAIKKISDMGELWNQSLSTMDVTEEYYDSNARLKVLEKKEERLMSFMDKAEKIEELIALENELSCVRSDIEVLKGRLKYLENATAYSQVNINLEQSIPGKVTAPEGTFGKAVQGLIGSINCLVNVAGAIFVGILMAVPWAGILALLYLLFRLIKRKREKPED